MRFKKELLDKKLRSHSFLVAETDQGIVLKRGTIKLELSGELSYEVILVILTATSGQSASAKNICEQFPVHFRDNVLNVLELLLKERFLYLEELTRPVEESSKDVFYWQFEKNRPEVIQTLSELNIVIVGVNEMSLQIADKLSDLEVQNLHLVDDAVLRSSSFETEEGELDLTNPSLEARSIWQSKDLLSNSEAFNFGAMIVGSQFGGQFLFLKWNELCVKLSKPFLPVLIEDMIGYVGPLVLPGETGCLQCLRLRQDAQWENPNALRRMEIHATQGQSIAAIPPALISILAGAASFELIHFFGEFPHPRPAFIRRFDLISGNFETKWVLKFPRCPVCSELENSASITVRRLNPMNRKI